ncbi:hypothetical protein ACFV2H_10965 [Streptomyces sp. NPDC059629]|uniref:hypothetical protein n=1 Tax=Streptomyces sp. NPDC059629 TaxID=3346889 RepID=UPI0036A2DCD3
MKRRLKSAVLHKAAVLLAAAGFAAALPTAVQVATSAANGPAAAHSVTVRANGRPDEWNSTGSSCTRGCGPAIV